MISAEPGWRDREVPPEAKNMVADVANAFAQIVNEVMHFASEQPDGGPGGHTIALICMAACEMVTGILVEHYVKPEAIDEVRAIARHIYEETKKGVTVTAKQIEDRPSLPN
jgi:hypothetical protein